MSCPLNSSCFCRFRSTSRCSAIYIEDHGGYRKRERERGKDAGPLNHYQLHHTVYTTRRYEMSMILIYPFTSRQMIVSDIAHTFSSF